MNGADKSQQPWAAERRRLERRLADAEFGRLEADARAARAERDLAQAQAWVHQAQIEAAGLRAEVAALRASTSWKLTRPLRGVSRLLGKG